MKAAARAPVCEAVISPHHEQNIKTEGRVLALSLFAIVTALLVLLVPPAANAVPAAGGDSTACCPQDEETCERCWESGGNLLFSQQNRYILPEGETQVRDLYLFAGNLKIEGTLDGDILAFVQEGRISGTVTEDLNLFAETIRIEGEIGDDLRVACKNLYIDGTVRGNVVAACATLHFDEEASIEGDLLVACGVADVNGSVGGAAKIITGVLNIDGSIAGNAEVTTDGGIDIGPNARFGGDLHYEGPDEIDIPPGIVAGEVQFFRKVEKEKPEFHLTRAVEAGIHILGFIAALIAGTLIVAFTKDHARQTAETIRKKPLKSVGIGFIAFICVPIVLLILLVMIITIPLMFVVLMSYLIALYIAKFYVAIWLGNLILQRSGRTDVSPIPSLLLGLVPIYLVTAIPIAGTLIGIVIIFFGLGALLQRKETRLDTAFEPPPAPEGALPSTFPGSPAAPAAPIPPPPPAGV